MSNEIQIFNNKEFGNVRILVIDEEEWFVGKDIATALGYKDTSDALKKHVDTEDKMSRQIADSRGRQQNTYLVNESGFYCLILNSKLKGVKEFKRWVTKEVLTMIHKTGTYISEICGINYQVILQNSKNFYLTVKKQKKYYQNIMK